MTRGSGQGGIYYGWWVLGASAISEMLAIGATSYSAGLFVLPLQHDFGLSRAVAQSPVLLVYLGAVLFAPTAGRILDRLPVRWAVSVGAMLFAAALALIAAISSLPLMALLLLIPASAGFMLFGPLTTSTMASRWFYRRRGLAQGVAALALSGGGLIVAPLMGHAIASWGWRAALAGEAATIFAIVVLLALLVLKDNPFRAGLGDHPENQGRAAPLQGQASNLDGTLEFRGWRQILGNKGFWAPSLMLASATGVGETIVIALQPYGHQLGLATGRLGLLISCFALAAALAKIAVGAVADHQDKRILLFAFGFGVPLSMGLLSWFANYPALLLASLCAGIATGGIQPVATALLAARFGAARFGSVMGWTYALFGAATILAVIFTGMIFDRTGSYHAAFVGLLTISLLLMVLSLVIDRRQQA